MPICNSQCCKGRPKMTRKGADRINASQVASRLQVQKASVKEDAPTPGATAASIECISNQGMAYVAEVCTDLMQSATAQPHLHKACGLMTRTHEVMDCSKLCHCCDTIMCNL